MKKKILRVFALALIVCLCATFLNTRGATALAASGSGSLIDTSELFTERDMSQSAELDSAVCLQLSDGENLTITEEGVYVIRGSAEEATVVVDAEDAKVQLVLDGVSITNSDFPCIYVRSADKVFVTTSADSSLTVTGSFTGDGETNTDGVIYSKSDLVLNGTAVLSIRSSANGIVSKDDLKITGGSYVITAQSHAIEGKDSIRIAGGTLQLTAGKDGLHADNSEDAEKGYVYIADGEITIQATDDGIHAVSFLQIDGGSLTISAYEGLESTYVLLNGGSISIQASDDGVNAANKSSFYRATVEVNGGDISISMGAGDTDGIDSNGDLILNGGTVSITGSSCFDVDGTVSFNGGTVYENGRQVSTITVQMMGGGMGGMRGGWGGMGGNTGGMGGGPGGWGGPRG